MAINYDLFTHTWYGHTGDARDCNSNNKGYCIPFISVKDQEKSIPIGHIPEQGDTCLHMYIYLAKYILPSLHFIFQRIFYFYFI